MATDIATQEDGLEPLKGHYPPDIILAGLHALAANGGDSHKARDLLKHTYGDQAPTDRTLRNWRNINFPRRYHQLLNEQAPALEAAVTAQLREGIALQTNIHHRVLEKLNDKLENIPPEKLAETASKLGVSRGIDIDKLLILTGRPTNITETRNADEILRALEAKLPHIDSTAEDIQD